MATLTITVNDTHVPRIQTAFGSLLGLDQDATAEEVRQHLVAYMKDVVERHERRAVVPDPLDVT